MKKQICLFLLTLLLCNVWLNPLPTSARSPDTFYVSPTGSDEFGNGSQTWGDSDNSTDWSAGDTGPWLTIKHAVDAAADGDIINVVAGTYNLKAPIKIDKPLTISGNITDPGSVVINAPSVGTAPYPSDKDCFQVRANDVTIEGFRIQGAHLVWPGVGDGWQNAGIAIGGDPAMLGGMARPLIGIQNTVIQYNEITDNSYGIHAYRAQHITIANNKIFTNTQDGNWSGKGILFYSQVWPGAGGDPDSSIQTKDIDILNNQIYDNELMGIEFNSTDGVGGDLDLDALIDGNVFYNNGGPWDDLGYNFDVYRGISANGTFGGSETGVTISNNEFYDHQVTSGARFSNGSAAVRLYNARNWIISNNHLHNNLAGIRLSGSLTSGNQMTGNNIHDNTQGIRFEAGKNGSAHHNKIYNNNVSGYIPDNYPPYGIQNISSTTFDAAYNWWGHTAGPVCTENPSGRGDSVSGAVAWDPWYDSPAQTTIVSHKPVHNVTVDSYYDSIQAAIEAAADGDIIKVAAGTYDENIDIKRRITLRGAGTDNLTGTILQNTAAPALIAGSPYSYKPVVVISASGIEGSPVVLKDLLIRTHQDNVSGAQLPGILPRPGTTVSWLELDNVRVCGTRSKGTAESGLLLDDFSSLNHVVINDSAFEDMAYGIIFFNNSNTGTNAGDIEINRSTFKRNSIKGFYAEKLSEAIFREVSVTDNGDTTLSPEWADASNSGIDINLKFGDYVNITLKDLTVTGNGMGSENGAGIKVKARGTGLDTSYNSRPANLAGVTIEGGTYTGNQAGIRFGEPGKENTGPNQIKVSRAVITGNLQYNISNTISGETIDAAGNWWGTADGNAIQEQVDGAVTFTPWHLQKLSGLAADSLTHNSLVLRWTAGGIWEGDIYDYRYATFPLDNPAAWDKAERLAGKPVPADGSQEMLVRRLKANTRYYFGLASVSGNLRSETAYLEAVTLAQQPVDNQPPAAVTDLTPAPGSPAATSVVLNWTAVGDDGSQGFAARYIIKQSESPIDAANFNAAASVYHNRNIKPAGQTESIMVTRLQPGTRYYFALKVQDEADNFSPMSNLAEIVTADVLPAVTGISPGSGDNSETRTLNITGINFTGSGNTIVRLVNNDNLITLKEVSVKSAAELTAVLPKGGPPGIYSVRITNTNGTSASSSTVYEIQPAPQPLPVVTNISPNIAPANTPRSGLQISGRNFTGASSVTLNGYAAALITVDSDTRITIDVPGLPPGEYDIRITTPAGTNEVSAIQLTMFEPIVLDDTVIEEVATSGIIELVSEGVIPVQVTMTSDSRAEAARNTTHEVDISVVIPPGTLVTDISGNPYAGTLNPPQVVKPDASLAAGLPGDAVVIEMGNPQQAICFHRDFTAVLTIAANTAPRIYYYNKVSAQYEFAGKSGTLDGVSYIPGGTILNQANGSYTIGLLLDHMSVYVASATSLLPALPPAVTSVSYLATDFFGTRALFSLDINGRVPAEIRASSADGRLVLTLPAGTLIRDKNGLPLHSLMVEAEASPPVAPADLSIVVSYRFGPAGAILNPAAILVYDYTRDTLPAGIGTAELTWAFYDETEANWVELASTVDTSLGTVTTAAGHFTTFAVIAARPAVFTASSLAITPSPAAPGQPVMITVSITNRGGTAGTHTAVLRIDSIKEAEIMVNLAAGGRQTVTFSVARDTPGTYQVEVDGLAGDFTVVGATAPAPAAFNITGLTLDVAESRPGSKIWISVQLANNGGTAGRYPLVLRINGVREEEKEVDLAAGENRTVVFTVTRDKPGTYLVEAGGKTVNFTISNPAGRNFNWLLIAGAAILAVIILLVRQLNKRRHNSKA